MRYSGADSDALTPPPQKVFAELRLVLQRSEYVARFLQYEISTPIFPTFTNFW